MQKGYDIILCTYNGSNILHQVIENLLAMDGYKKLVN